MELEEQICSLELAKRLKELGVDQVSEYEWEQDRRVGEKGKRYLKTSGVRGCARCGAIINGIPRPTLYTQRFAGFTVAELGEMLPDRTRTDKRDAEWWVSCEKLLKPEIADTEADARAKMLIYLLENKLL